MSILSIMVVALISEAVWETLKMTWQHGKVSIDRIGALSMGIALAFITGIDMLKMLNISSRVSFAGILLTGILISRGANFTHDLLTTVNNIQVRNRVTTSDRDQKQNT